MAPLEGVARAPLSRAQLAGACRGRRLGAARGGSWRTESKYPKAAPHAAGEICANPGLQQNRRRSGWRALGGCGAPKPGRNWPNMIGIGPTMPKLRSRLGSQASSEGLRPGNYEDTWTSDFRARAQNPIFAAMIVLSNSTDVTSRLLPPGVGSRQSARRPNGQKAGIRLAKLGVGQTSVLPTPRRRRILRSRSRAGPRRL